MSSIVKSSSSSSIGVRGVAQRLVAHTKTKAEATAVLNVLADAGLIKGIDSEAATTNFKKRSLTQSSIDQGKVKTPYGPLIQSLEINAAKCKHWEYINPFAWLYYVSTISPSFANMLRDCTVDGNRLRIVIYSDALVPGNPFRPEPARKLNCIYWCIAEWPQYVLQRSFAWPVFSILREEVIHSLPGGLPRLMRLILHVFFGNSGSSFTTGVHIACRSGDFVIKAEFGGFLADLLGHKEITDWKGTGGTLICPECSNVINHNHRRCRAGEVFASCWNRDKFNRRSSSDVFAIIDELSTKKATLGKDAFKKLETAKGFNHNEYGLLQDHTLRAIYKPIEHCIRDWQHTMCQDGVANTHLFYMIRHLQQKFSIRIEDIQAFSQLCKYPSAIGKLEKSAFGRSRLRPQSSSIASFSSIILTMMQVMYLFLESFVGGNLGEHFEAFQKLWHIVGLLRMGAEDAVQHADTLLVLIADHLRLITKLYGNQSKPKAHHLFHVVDGMVHLGRLLSCFVTERKHKAIKASALWVFRHLEHTVLHDVLNKSIVQILDGHDLYKEAFLVAPVTSIELASVVFRRSRKCVLRIGLVSAGDLIINDEGDVAKVLSVFQQSIEDELLLEVDVYPSINGDTRCRARDRSHRRFFKASSIIDVLIWYEDSPNIIRCAIPPALLYK